MSCASVGMKPRGLILGGILVAGALASTAVHAQATTTYSYGSSNQLLQAISSAGTGVAYQYDPAGNLLAVNEITPQELNPGSGDTITISTPGEAKLLSFIITTG